MASKAWKKKRKDEVTEKDSDDESSSEDESVDSESDVDHNLEIQVEFEARTPEASDFDGIKRLLQQLLVKCGINVSELTEIILSQSEVGSVIKCIPEEDDDDNDENETCGITTVLNLNRHKDSTCIKDLIELVKTKCDHGGFLKILTNPDNVIGWLISERYINIPAHIAPPLYASLRSEIIKACRKGKPFEFSYLLYICKSYKLDVSVKRKKKKQTEEENALMFINAEDEILSQRATEKVDYDVTEQSHSLVTGKWQDGDNQMRPYRTVMLIPWSKMETITSEMEQFVS
ncbi:protein BCCIP homolog [Xenia sp. Carnegie-2017]|uniref:protein BCCIP homolog n=1 Tax=Xenia sp. Carnegie-2017 TaxID=2897299 RepID=UPI001F032EE1|nr:protein BCCIP homolog [Xenia sp. Carnegie-2017]XP_046850346.1 protein BCCIP homolog [Xenia sp. Carnegie-2017]XP_046850347.1 protein BCCIP homolog [Xenia sp. Carnegie-2017]